ncbi:ABC transporter ATP-binding protein [Aggregicoccus sp. 17bor-14]|uniref:ABC transporter ATP-binding protein n=1 Tax=Myxococcaceae TaxID=31 RepID=UPI00129C5FB7|nr:MULTISPECIES: ABC transporter ATP-binding protein [Myxococcaceae]MBF5041665.1 ABC transporter ATP-binding protein [Simulacricoccus sp. 17bor-14]MRI87449.1 ABC transporter ATP-binding protein [Aggregicoccus sp. 17bor-14]
MLTQLLRTYLRPYRGLLLAVAALQTVQVMTSLYLPRLNADLIDRGIATGDTGYIWRIGAAMLAVTLVQVAFAVGATYLSARTAMGFGRDVRGALFHRVTGYSAREVAQLGAPSLITRITNDVQQVQLLVVMSSAMLVPAPITVVGGLVMALQQDGPLSLILAVSIPVLAGSIGLVTARMVPLYQQLQVRIDRVNQVLREQLTGLRVVRAFVREPHEMARFGSANDAVMDTALRAGRLMAFLFPIVILVLNASSVAALWFGALRLGAGQMQVGALIAFLSYLVQILISVMMATFVTLFLPRARVCAVRIQEVLDTRSSVVTAPNPVTELPRRGLLELQGVGFRYPGAEAPVLAGVSLTAHAGQVTAIIGSTGAGKSTLINLVPRLFDATEGSVRVDGVDVRALEPELLWSRIGLVPQRPFLFSGTVASNLRYADPQATDEALWRALEVAQAADFVRQLPGGLEAPITQGGTNVSGGQRQRLAIARALVRRPSIYLFDDAFSALDTATDARLRAALRPVTAEATVLIVAQRVSSIAHADQILVLEDGRPVGLGTHRELLETCATYREIAESQRTAEEAA